MPPKKNRKGKRQDSRKWRGSGSRADSGSNSSVAGSVDHRAEGACGSAGAESGGDSSGSTGRRKREDAGSKGVRTVKPRSSDSDDSSGSGRRKREDAGGKGERIVKQPKSDSDESPRPHSSHISEQVPDLKVQKGPEVTADSSPPAPHSSHISEQVPDLKLEVTADSSPPAQRASAPFPTSEKREGEFRHKVEADVGKVHDRSKSSVDQSSRAQGSSQGTGQVPVIDESLKSDFLHFLKNFIAPGETRPYYLAEARAKIARGGCSKFRVQYEHLLIHKTDLAINLCKRRYLCFPVVKEFLVDCGHGREALKQQDLELYHFPKSIVTLEDLLADKSKLVATMTKVLGMSHVSVRVLTDLTIALFSGFIAEIWDKHSKGLSWNGAYSAQNMVVINGCEYRIMTRPWDYEALHSLKDRDSFVFPKNQDPFAKARVKDVKGLEQIFTPKLRAKESAGDTDENLPVLYKSLQLDMSRVTEADVKDPWFRAYLLNHPVFKHPVVRHNLVCNLHLLCTEFHLLPEKIQDSLKQLPGMRDWCLSAKSDAEVLKNVYYYDPADHDGQGKAKVVTTQDTKEPFERSYLGHLEYERHYLNHAHRTVPGYSIEEQEIFFSSRFNYLPELLKLLMRNDAFTERQNKLKNSDDGKKKNVCEAWMPYVLYQRENVDCVERGEVLNLCFW